jgi:PAS domain S-box-containing protein
MQPTTLDLHQLVATAGDAMVVAGTDGRIQLWNAAATRLFGFSEEEAMAATLDLIIPERLRPRHWAGYDKTMETAYTKYGTDLLRVPALHKEGTPLSIAFTVSLLTDGEGKVTGIGAVIRDDTQRFNDERTLRARLKELENQAEDLARQLEAKEIILPES